MYKTAARSPASACIFSPPTHRPTPRCAHVHHAHVAERSMECRGARERWVHRTLTPKRIGLSLPSLRAPYPKKAQMGQVLIKPGSDGTGSRTPRRVRAVNGARSMPAGNREGGIMSADTALLMSDPAPLPDVDGLLATGCIRSRLLNASSLPFHQGFVQICPLLLPVPGFLFCEYNGSLKT
jgi:hypothetical protein